MNLRNTFGTRRSARRRLILWNAAAIAIMFVGLGLLVRFSVQSILISSIDRELQDQLERTAAETRLSASAQGEALKKALASTSETLRRSGVAAPASPGPASFPDRLRYTPIVFRLHRDPNSPTKLWDPGGYEAAKAGRDITENVAVAGAPMRSASMLVKSGGVPIGVAQVVRPLADVNLVLSSLTLVMLALLPLALLLSVSGSIYVTGRVLGRVHDINQSVQQLQADDLAKRLPAAGEDEFSELAGTFNGMLDRVQAAFQEQTALLEQQRRFTADASHELRTPLTVIKGSSGLALKPGASEESLRASMCEVARSADRMSRLVEDLLLLARADGKQLGKVKVELMIREVLVEAIRLVSWQHPGSEIALDIAEEDVCVLGDETELIRLFANLVDNAARHGRQVTVHGITDGEAVRVLIEDDGPGVAAENLPHLGKRFYRIDQSRAADTGGNGLGLSICREIVDAHSGSLDFTSAPGKGLIVTVTFPHSPA